MFTKVRNRKKNILKLSFVQGKKYAERVMLKNRHIGHTSSITLNVAGALFV